MKTKSLAAAAFGALVFGIVTATAQAAPVIDVGAIKVHAGDSGGVEKITWGWHRHCSWHRGHRHCHWGRYHWRRHHHTWGWRRGWHYHQRYW